MCSPACHAAIVAPVVSRKIAIRPTAITSVGPNTTLPPAGSTLAATPSTSSTLTYVVQCGGPGSWAALIAATCFPPLERMV